MYTVTTSRGLAVRTRFTYSSTGLVISRYGDSMTFSGTEKSSFSHCATSARVSASSTLTVTASSTSGRVARAYASARRVGRCSFDTSTIAWLRDGSVIGSRFSSAARSSSATRS